MTPTSRSDNAPFIEPTDRVHRYVDIDFARQLERELAEKARLVEVERGIAESNSGARGEIEQLQQRVKELEAKCVEMRSHQLTLAICLFAKRLFDKSDA